MGVTRDLARVHSIGKALVRFGFGHHLARVPLFRGLGLQPADGAPLRDMSTAQRFAGLLEQLGPTFVKLGQILSTRPDLLPPAFIAELSHLQDKVPPLPFEQVRQVLVDELGEDALSSFTHVGEQPLASASIAQVHPAKLADGTPVVIKIQRPGIGEQMAIDSDLICRMARVFELVFEEAGTYGPVAIVEEWQKGLALELDFISEARAIEAFGRCNAERPLVRVPRLYREHCTRRVLTMERLAGRRLLDVTDPDERGRIAKNLIRSAFEQVFEDGLFHADPHPGNYLILDDGAIGILDFGLVGRLTKDSQDSLIALALGMAMGDADTVSRLVYRIGNPQERIQLSQFRSEMRLLLDHYLDLRLEQVETRVLARELLDLMARFKLRVPREFALLAKAAVTLEGVTRDLAPDLDVRSTILPYTERLLSERFDPRQLEGGGLKLLLHIAGFVQDLPMQVSQALLDIETGKTTVRVEGAPLRKLASSIQALGVAVLCGALALGSLIAGALASAQTGPRIGSFPAPLVYGSIMAAAALIVGALAIFGQGRFRRLRLRRRASASRAAPFSSKSRRGNSTTDAAPGPPTR